MTDGVHYRYCPEGSGEHEPDIPDDWRHSYNKSYHDHERESADTAPVFPEPCVFAMKFKIFFIKGIFHGRPSLLLSVGQFVKDCLLFITKSLKIQDKLILIQNKSFFGIQKFFESLAAFLESIILLLEILDHKLLDCGMWHIYHLGSYEMIIQKSAEKSESLGKEEPSECRVDKLQGAGKREL